MLLRIATVAVAGLVVFSAADAEARGHGGGGRSGGPSVSSGLGRSGPALTGSSRRSEVSRLLGELRERAGPLGPIVSRPERPIGGPIIRPGGPIVRPGGPIIGRPIPIIRPLPPIIRPPMPFPRPPHGHGRYRHGFFVGGEITSGCAVEFRRRFDPETGQFYRVRVVLCPPVYY